MAATHSKYNNYCPAFGNYPKEYNRAVHGPYYPWVNYGPKPEIKFRDVKLGDLGKYIANRNKAPWAIIAACGRQFNGYIMRWRDVRNPRYLPYCVHTLLGICLVSFVTQYGQLRQHRQHKYRW